MAKRRGQSPLQIELGQRRGFASVGQEATIDLLRTASVIRGVLERVVEPEGLSLAQYNALRIVRGSGTGGIATLAIRDRMIEEGTTITRILDKLETAGWIARERSSPDRRQVTCVATGAGKALLDRLDPQVDKADAEVVDVLKRGELEQFIGMLDRVRAANAGRGAARRPAGARDG
jgi:DNA-binding MarR family transcriptional regulator